jgi:serine/threonine protein kinase
VGQRFDSYELIDRIGAGGMGEVWRAFDHAIGRHVAIKILPPEYSRDPDRLRRFEQEARAAGMLNHPNVLVIYAIGRHDASPYLVSELLEGVTLRQRLTQGAVPEMQALDYADQLVQGLAAAHDKGVVHRDLKPDNIFVTTDGRVKILDFGLAKLTASAPDAELQTQTATGVALGTPAYMSPEQIRGQQADHRSDIFAVGAVLYEMLAGRRAFVGDTGAEAMTAILKQEPPPLAGVSEPVEQIVRHCLEKAPASRYQSARDLAFQLRLLRPGSQPSRPSTRWQLPALLIATIVAGAWLMSSRRAPVEPPSPAPSFKRLTSDSGLTTDPAFSPDGKLVVYASDRAGEGNLDIWRQEILTSETVRLTSDAADESEPTFSPDGNRIAFRSERDGGGIWIVSAFGGEPRLIARHGRRPRFSPDGSRIAFWVSSHVWYMGQIFTVSVEGGTARRLQPDFASALNPIWSADSTKLLFNGVRDPKDVPVDAFDWWISPVDGGTAVRTGALDILRRQNIKEGRQHFSSLIAPADWIGDDVFFSGWTDESTNLWRIAVPQNTGRAEGTAHKLTSGTASEAKPSVNAQGRVAFASMTNVLNIWSLAVAANRGTVSGAPQQVTNSAFDARTSVSADGKTLVFLSTRLGNLDVWKKDLASGRETALTMTSAREEESEITADGTRVFYSVIENSKGVVYQLPITGGPSERLCDDCGRPWDWSPRGDHILFMIEEGRRHPHVALGLLDVTTHQKRDYLQHPDFTIARVRFSPDGRWMAFVAVNASGSHIVIAPFRSDTSPAPATWIPVTEHLPTIHDKPRWSPDGNLLYFTSEADGFSCIWAQRLDPQTKRPIGVPTAVSHWHSARRSLRAVPLFQELSVTADRLFFNVSETSGNIWMAEWRE